MLNFKIPRLAGICHFNSDLYQAGGCHWPGVMLSQFKKINDSGEVSNLSPIPLAAVSFPLTSWRIRKAIITLGGFGLLKWLK